MFWLSGAHQEWVQADVHQVGDHADLEGRPAGWW